LKQLCEFANGSGAPPLADSLNVDDQSRVEESMSRLHKFLDRLNDEFPNADQPTKDRVRLALRQVFTPASPVSSIHWAEVVMAAGLFLGWLVVFTMGYTMSAKPYETNLKASLLDKGFIDAMSTFIPNLVLFIFSSIPTNVLLLSGLAACLGTAYRRANGREDQSNRIGMPQDYLCSIATSFVVYISIIAGMLTLSVAETITNESQEKQLQLAGTISLCSFLVGYDRELVVWMLRRAASFFSQREPSTSHGKP
jgi:hypothetical protein